MFIFIYLLVCITLLCCYTIECKNIAFNKYNNINSNNHNHNKIFPTINSFYSEKEICQFQLNNETINITDGFHQTICKNKNNIIMNSHLNLHANTQILIPKTCHMGIARRAVGLHNLIDSYRNENGLQSSNRVCKYRHIWERPYNEIINKDIKYDYIGQFISKFESSKYNIMKSFGDSVTLQTNHFHSCDMLRYGYSLSGCGKAPLRYQQVGTFGCDRLKTTNTGKILTMISQGLLFPCIYTECINVNQSISEYITTLLCTEHGGNAIIIFNYGLHIHIDKGNTDPLEIIDAMASALIYCSKWLAERGHLLVFRETTAQHYMQLDGEFEHQDDSVKHNSIVDTNSGDNAGMLPKSKSKLKHNISSIQQLQQPQSQSLPFCCNAIQQAHSHSLFSTDASLLLVLDRIDPLWREHMKWMSFYELSDHMYNMHFETSYSYSGSYSGSSSDIVSSNGIKSMSQSVTRFPTDCTHLVYGSRSYGLLAQGLVALFD